jgi:hypothetical protein
MQNDPNGSNLDESKLSDSNEKKRLQTRSGSASEHFYIV